MPATFLGGILSGIPDSWQRCWRGNTPQPAQSTLEPALRHSLEGLDSEGALVLLRLSPTVSLLCVYRFWLHFIVHSLFGNVPGCLFGHTLYSSHQVIDIYDVHNLHHYPTLCRLVPLSCVRARTSVLALVHAFLLSNDLFKQQLGLCSLAPLGWQYWSKAPTKAPTKAVDYLC